MSELKPLPEEELFPERTHLGELLGFNPTSGNIQTEVGLVTFASSSERVKVALVGGDSYESDSNVGKKTFQIAKLVEFFQKLGVADEIEQLLEKSKK